jgi:hypothetical protein
VLNHYTGAKMSTYYHKIKTYVFSGVLLSTMLASPSLKDGYADDVPQNQNLLLNIAAMLSASSSKTSSLSVKTVTSAGQVWMDRNLGAQQVASSYNDPLAFGDLYQWGRLTDGHEKRDSSTTYELSDSDIPGHGNFILGPGISNWRDPSSVDLWQLSGINNPCPDGFRVPISAEWETERLSWISNDPDGAFASPLKLVVGGWRYYDNNGKIYSDGLNGHYWSSTATGPYNSEGFNLYNDGQASIALSSRNRGHSIRCIKE